MKRILLCILSVLAIGSCTLPTLRDLESVTRSSCDAAHPCVTGWRCDTDGFCIENAGGTGGGSVEQCTGAETRSCGMDAGQCRVGTETCSGGVWGSCMGDVIATTEVCDDIDNDCNGPVDDNAVDAGVCPMSMGVCANKRTCHPPCTAATYGPDFESGSETKCDLKDNDCDGQTDEGLSSACALQVGECVGARISCINGAFPGCDAGVYLSNNVAYEPYETKCDGKDNDCDGKIDAWAATNVSASGAKSRRPTAVAIPGGSGDVMVMWEEEEPSGSAKFKVKVRRVRLDNTMSAALAPGSSAGNSVKNSLPALAVDNGVIMGAWTEEGANGARRVQLATLDPLTGFSTVPGLPDGGGGGGGALTIDSSPDMSLQPNDLALAFDTVSGTILAALVDGNTLQIYAFPTTLFPPPIMTYPKKVIAMGVTHPRLSPAGAGHFWLTFEDGAGLQRCLIDGVGNKTCAPAIGPARFGVLTGVTAGSPFGATSLFVLDAGAGDRVFTSSCTDGGTCAAPGALAVVPARTVMQELRATTTARPAAPTFVAWDEGSTYRFVVTTRTDGGAQPGVTTQGRRPWPVFTGTNRGGVVFDTESDTSGAIAPDDVFLQRFCF